MPRCSDIYVGTHVGLLFKFDEDGNLLTQVETLGFETYNPVHSDTYEVYGTSLDSAGDVFFCTTTEGSPSGGLRVFDCIQRLSGDLATSYGYIFDAGTYFGRTDLSVVEQNMALTIDRDNNVWLFYELGAPSGSPVGTPTEWYLIKMTTDGTILGQWQPDVAVPPFGAIPLVADHPEIDFSSNFSKLYYVLSWGDIYTWDPVNNVQLSKFKDQGATWTSGNPRYKGLQVLCDGKILVANESNDRVDLYNSDGTLNKSILQGSINGNPRIVALGVTDNLFWVDNDNQSLVQKKTIDTELVLVSFNIESFDPIRNGFATSIASCTKPRDRCKRLLPQATLIGAT